MPNEILSLIFAAYVDDATLPETATKRAIECSHVDSTWRKVAIATAEIWTRIFLSFNSRSLDLTRDSAQVPCDLLSRSKQRLVDISIESAFILFMDDGDSEILSALKSVMHRVNLLFVEDLGMHIVDFMKSVISLPTPNLEYLLITSSELCGIDPPVDIRQSLSGFDILPHCPLLSFIEADAICFWDVPHDPYSGVTHFSAGELYPENVDLFNLLRRFPGLEDLVLMGPDNDFNISDHPEWPILPPRSALAVNLRSLSLVNDCVHLLNSLLEVTTLPQLVEVDIEARSGIDARDVLTELTEIAPQITKLRLSGSEFSYLTADALRQFTSLSTLCLEDSELFAHFWVYLSYTVLTSIPLPRLTCLTLVGCTFYRRAALRFHEFIHDRSRPVFSADGVVERVKLSKLVIHTTNAIASQAMLRCLRPYFGPNDFILVQDSAAHD